MTTATIATVTAIDGTTIGYRQYGPGNGPGLVLLHGSMSSGHHHRELAELLADEYRVYVPDRRGRGLSGPYRPDDGLDTEVGDLTALLDQTGAQAVFGVSSGGIIALETARRRPSLTEAVIFEPPLSADRAHITAVLAELDARLDRGDIPAALVTGMKAAEMGPALIRALPDGLLAKLTGMMLRGEERKPKGEYVPMRALAPNLRYDFRVVLESAGRTYPDIKADVLLLSGSRSPRYLREATARLEIPGATRIELPGLDHGASWNSDVRGNPAPVAAAIRTHLSH